MAISMMTVQEAVQARGFGYLSGASVQRVEGGWSLQVSGGSLRAWVCERREKRVRVFKSLDAAITALEGLGFSVDGLTLE